MNRITHILSGNIIKGIWALCTFLVVRVWIRISTARLSLGSWISKNVRVCPLFHWLPLTAEYESEWDDICNPLETLLGFFYKLDKCDMLSLSRVCHRSMYHHRAFCWSLPPCQSSILRYSALLGWEHPGLECVSSGETMCWNKPSSPLLGSHDPSFSPLFSLLFLRRINFPSSPFHLANLGRIEFLPLYFCIP